MFWRRKKDRGEDDVELDFSRMKLDLSDLSGDEWNAFVKSVRNQVLIEKVVKLAEAKEFDKALEVARDISDEWNRSWALIQIAKSLANSYAEAGEPDKALEIYKKIDDKEFGLVYGTFKGAWVH